MAKKTIKSAIGTSFHSDTILASVEQLEAILGLATYEDNTGEDKVNFEWDCELESGHQSMHGKVFTIYDYKEYRKLSRTEMIEWHIGGQDKAVTMQAYFELVDMLKNK